MIASMNDHELFSTTEFKESVKEAETLRTLFEKCKTDDQKI